MDKHVLVTVLGGVAYVSYASPGVEVRVVDLDNEPDIIEIETELAALAKLDNAEEAAV